MENFDNDTANLPAAGANATEISPMDNTTSSLDRNTATYPAIRPDRSVSRSEERTRRFNMQSPGGSGVEEVKKEKIRGKSREEEQRVPVGDRPFRDPTGTTPMQPTYSTYNQPFYPPYPMAYPPPMQMYNPHVVAGKYSFPFSAKLPDMGRWMRNFERAFAGVEEDELCVFFKNSIEPTESGTLATVVSRDSYKEGRWTDLKEEIINILGKKGKTIEQVDKEWEQRLKGRAKAETFEQWLVDVVGKAKEMVNKKQAGEWRIRLDIVGMLSAAEKLRWKERLDEMPGNRDVDDLTWDEFATTVRAACGELKRSSAAVSALVSGGEGQEKSGVSEKPSFSSLKEKYVALMHAQLESWQKEREDQLTSVARILVHHYPTTVRMEPGIGIVFQETNNSREQPSPQPNRAIPFGQRQPLSTQEEAYRNRNNNMTGSQQQQNRSGNTSAQGLAVNGCLFCADRSHTLRSCGVYNDYKNRRLAQEISVDGKQYCRYPDGSMIFRRDYEGRGMKAAIDSWLRNHPEFSPGESPRVGAVMQSQGENIGGYEAWIPHSEMGRQQGDPRSRSTVGFAEVNATFARVPVVSEEEAARIERGREIAGVYPIMGRREDEPMERKESGFEAGVPGGLIGFRKDETVRVALTEVVDMPPGVEERPVAHTTTYWDQPEGRGYIPGKHDETYAVEQGGVYPAGDSAGREAVRSQRFNPMARPQGVERDRPGPVPQPRVEGAVPAPVSSSQQPLQGSDSKGKGSVRDRDEDTPMYGVPPETHDKTAAASKRAQTMATKKEEVEKVARSVVERIAPINVNLSLVDYLAAHGGEIKPILRELEKEVTAKAAAVKTRPTTTSGALLVGEISNEVGSSPHPEPPPLLRAVQVFINAEVNNRVATIMIDQGAECSLTGRDSIEKYGLEVVPLKDKALVGVGGIARLHSIAYHTNWKLLGVEKQHPVYVLDKDMDGLFIFGMPGCIQFRLFTRVDQGATGVYVTIFDHGIGQDVSKFISLDEIKRVRTELKARGPGLEAESAGAMWAEVVDTPELESEVTREVEKHRYHDTLGFQWKGIEWGDVGDWMERRVTEGKQEELWIRRAMIPEIRVLPDLRGTRGLSLFFGVADGTRKKISGFDVKKLEAGSGWSTVEVGIEGHGERENGSEEEDFRRGIEGIATNAMTELGEWDLDLEYRGHGVKKREVFPGGNITSTGRTGSRGTRRSLRNNFLEELENLGELVVAVAKIQAEGPEIGGEVGVSYQQTTSRGPSSIRGDLSSSLPILPRHLDNDLGYRTYWGLARGLSPTEQKRIRAEASILAAYKSKARKVKMVNEDGADPLWPKIRTELVQRNVDLDKPYEGPPVGCPAIGSDEEEILRKAFGPNSPLTETEQDFIINIFKRHPRSLAFSDEQLGCLRPDIYPPVRWYTRPHEPWNIVPRPPNADMRRKHIEFFNTKLDAGIAEPAASPYNNPWFFIRKANVDSTKPIVQQLRHITNLQKLNSNLYKVSGRPPEVDSFVEACAGYIFSTIGDLRSGYDQILVDPVVRNQVAKQTILGQLRWTRMDQGLAVAVAEFQLRINLALRKILAFAFIDDINHLGPRSWYNHEMSEVQGIRRAVFEYSKELEKMLNALITAGLVLSGQKLQLCREGTKIVGWLCGHEGRWADPKKVEKILKWDLPMTPTEIRGFLGMVNFYRILIEYISYIERPFYLALRKDPVIDKEAMQTAFEELKRKLVTAPVLKAPDCGDDAPIFIISTDASEVGWGGVLEQADEKGRVRPCRFESGLWHGPEESYGTPLKEALGALRVLRKMTPYVFFKPGSRLRTDSNSLKLMINSGPHDLPSAQLTRVVSAILLYPVIVEHIPGKANPVADALSRRGRMLGDEVSEIEDEDEVLDRELFGTVGMTGIGGAWIGVVEKGYTGRDLEVALFLDALQRPEGITDKEFIRLRREARKFMLREGKLYRKAKGIDDLPRLVIASEAEMRRLVREVHEELAHKGWGSTYSSIVSRFWFRGNLETMVKDHVRRCDTCQRWEGRRYQEPFHPTFIRSLFFRWYIDVVHFGMGEGGLTDALIVREGLSAWVEGKMFRGIPNGKQVRDFFAENILCRFGIPWGAVTDNANYMKAGFGPTLTFQYGFDRVKISAYHSPSNGPVERANGTLVGTLGRMCRGEVRKWPRFFPWALWADRVTVKRTTGRTPFYLVYGTDPVLPTDLAWRSFLNIDWWRVKTSEELLEARIEQLRMKSEEEWKAADQLRHRRILYAAAKQRSLRPESVRVKVGDLVLRANMKILKTFTGKLESRWFGPYRVTAILGNGSFRIEELDGTALEGTFSPDQIKLFWPEGAGEPLVMEPVVERELIRRGDEGDDKEEEGGLLEDEEDEKATESSGVEVELEDVSLEEVIRRREGRD